MQKVISASYVRAVHMIPTGKEIKGLAASSASRVQARVSGDVPPRHLKREPPSQQDVPPPSPREVPFQGEPEGHVQGEVLPLAETRSVDEAFRERAHCSAEPVSRADGHAQGEVQLPARTPLVLAVTLHSGLASYWKQEQQHSAVMALHDSPEPCTSLQRGSLLPHHGR